MGENEVVVAAPEVVPEVEAVAPITASSDPLDPTADVTEVSPEEGKTDTARIIPVRKSAVPRKPLDVPSSVHVHISAENLLEYVGPPSYQKDRMYTKTSPVGVSCGLGYLGNGSGAVMPIEVTVSFFPLAITQLPFILADSNFFISQCPVTVQFNSLESWVRSSKRVPTLPCRSSSRTLSLWDSPTTRTWTCSTRDRFIFTCRMSLFLFLFIFDLVADLDPFFAIQGRCNRKRRAFSWYRHLDRSCQSLYKEGNQR